MIAGTPMIVGRSHGTMAIGPGSSNAITRWTPKTTKAVWNAMPPPSIDPR